MKNVLFLYLVFLAVTAYGQSTIKLSQLPLVQATNTGSSDSVPITYYESSPTETARLLLQDLVNIPAFQTEFNTLIPPQSSHMGDCLFTNGTNTYWTACLSQESENANTVFAGPSSGSPAVPTFRALTGADLPTPTTSSLGGVKAINSVSHEWVSSISSSGVPGLTQPSCSDLSNAAASCSTDTTNASNITSGTLDTTLLPANAILGTDGTTAGVLGLSNGNAGGALVSLQNNSATSAYNFNLPSTAGVSGQVLMSGGGGTSPMTWGSAGGSGSGINILNNYNYNAELGATTDWTNSGGTFSVISSPASDVGNGTYSFSFLASASGQTVTSTLAAIPAGLYSQNCELSFMYKGFDSNMTAEVTDGTNVITSEALTASTGYTTKEMNFICPSSGSMEMELVSTGASAQGYFDEVHLGSATNLGQTSQAQLVGQIKISGCASPWSTTSTTMAAFPAQTGCTYTILDGNGITAPSTDIPGIAFSSLPPGNYLLRYEGTAGSFYVTGTGSGQFQFTDSTNFSNEVSDFGNAYSGQYIVGADISQTINYSTAQSNVTLQIYGLAQSGVNARIFGTTGNPGVISVYRFPTSSEQSWNPSTAPANWSGTQVGAGGGWTTTSTSYTAPSVATTSNTLTQISARNITCTADSGKGPIIDCTLPAAGSYKVCATATLYNSTAGTGTLVRIVDNNSNIISGGSEIDSTSSSAPYSVTSCGIDDITTLAGVTFNLQLAASSGTAGIKQDPTTPISWSVTGLDQSMQAPFTVGSVTSKSTGKEDIERAFINGSSAVCSTSTCTLDSSTPGISSVTRTSTGIYVVNFLSNTFSAAPTCTVSGNTFARFCDGSTTGTTTSEFNFSCSNLSGTVEDSAFSVICMGAD